MPISTINVSPSTLSVLQNLAITSGANLQQSLDSIPLPASGSPSGGVTYLLGFGGTKEVPDPPDPGALYQVSNAPNTVDPLDITMPAIDLNVTSIPVYIDPNIPQGGASFDAGMVVQNNQPDLSDNQTSTPSGSTTNSSYDNSSGSNDTEGTPDPNDPAEGTVSCAHKAINCSKCGECDWNADPPQDCDFDRKENECTEHEIPKEVSDPGGCKKKCYVCEACMKKEDYEADPVQPKCEYTVEAEMQCETQAEGNDTYTWTSSIDGFVSDNSTPTGMKERVQECYTCNIHCNTEKDEELYSHANYERCLSDGESEYRMNPDPHYHCDNTATYCYGCIPKCDCSSKGRGDYNERATYGNAKGPIDDGELCVNRTECEDLDGFYEEIYYEDPCAYLGDEVVACCHCYYGCKGNPDMPSDTDKWSQTDMDACHALEEKHKYIKVGETQECSDCTMTECYSCVPECSCGCENAGEDSPYAKSSEDACNEKGGSWGAASFVSQGETCWGSNCEAGDSVYCYQCSGCKCQDQGTKGYSLEDQEACEAQDGYTYDYVYDNPKCDQQVPNSSLQGEAPDEFCYKCVPPCDCTVGETWNDANYKACEAISGKKYEKVGMTKGCVEHDKSDQEYECYSCNDIVGGCEDGNAVPADCGDDEEWVKTGRDDINHVDCGICRDKPGDCIEVGGVTTDCEFYCDSDTSATIWSDQIYKDCHLAHGEYKWAHTAVADNGCCGVDLNASANGTPLSADEQRPGCYICYQCKPVEVLYSVTGIDDSFEIRVNGSATDGLECDRTNGAGRSFSGSFKVKGGDVVSAYAWDGWGNGSSCGGGEMVLVYANDNMEMFNINTLQLTTSGCNQCPDKNNKTPPCCEQAYWDGPPNNNIYTQVCRFTVPYEDPYCYDEVP